MKFRTTIVALGATALIATTGGATAQAAGRAPHQNVMAHAATTSGQGNALERARDYLELQAFSKKGLISQLKFEGYSTADAKWPSITCMPTGTGRPPGRPRTTSTCSPSRGTASTSSCSSRSSPAPKRSTASSRPTSARSLDQLLYAARQHTLGGGSLASIRR